MTDRTEDRAMAQLSAANYETLQPFRYFHFGKHPGKTSFLPVRKLTDYNLISYKNDQPSKVSVDNVKAPVLKVPSPDECKNLDTLEGFNRDVDYLKFATADLDEFLEAMKLRKLDPFENDFVSMRGAFRTIMMTPSHRSKRWRIGASMFRNTIFMRCFEGDNYAPMGSDQENEESYRYMNIKRLTTEPEEEVLDKDVIHKAFLSVFQAQLRRQQNFKLLYSGELDAIIDSNKDNKNPQNFTNLRMTLANKNEHKQKTFLLRKYPQWWAVSALSGLDKIIVANRDKNWNIEHYSEKHVPSMPRECEEYFKGQYALDVASFVYLYEFLEHVKKVMANEDDPKALYLFDYNFSTNPGTARTSTNWRVKSQSTTQCEASSEVQCKKIAEDFPEWRILPDWFIAEMKPLMKTSVLGDYLNLE